MPPHRSYVSKLSRKANYLLTSAVVLKCATLILYLTGVGRRSKWWARVCVAGSPYSLAWCDGPLIDLWCMAALSSQASQETRAMAHSFIHPAR